MKFYCLLLRLLGILLSTLVLILCGVGFDYALNTSLAASPSRATTDLSSQLKQILISAAPNNQGLKYFILPDSSQIDRIPADPNNPLTPEKIRLGQFLFHDPALSINPLNPKNWQ